MILSRPWGWPQCSTVGWLENLPEDDHRAALWDDLEYPPEDDHSAALWDDLENLPEDDHRAALWDDLENLPEEDHSAALWDDHHNRRVREPHPNDKPYYPSLPSMIGRLTFYECYRRTIHPADWWATSLQIWQGRGELLYIGSGFTSRDPIWSGWTCKYIVGSVELGQKYFRENVGNYSSSRVLCTLREPSEGGAKRGLWIKWLRKFSFSYFREDIVHPSGGQIEPDKEIFVNSTSYCNIELSYISSHAV